jgi:archaellin
MENRDLLGMAFSKKAIMGIGTLIIFIATILVAAVAAGVIISTSGVLQQKALIIGEQSQNRLVNGIEVTHIFAEGNTTEKTANKFEILSRPEPAAGPINYRLTSLSFFTDDGAYAAELEHPVMMEVNITVDVAVTSSWTAFGDLDGDGVTDSVRVQSDSGALDDYLQFNISSLGVSDNVSLEMNINSGGQVIDLADVPIVGNDTIYGYFHISDASSTANQIDLDTMRITDVFEGDCSFDKLIPETKFCLVTLVGEDDYYLEYGETVFIYFKVKSDNALEENDEFEFKIFPQDGRSTYILDRIPSVIYKRRINLYP